MHAGEMRLKMSWMSQKEIKIIIKFAVICQILEKQCVYWINIFMSPPISLYS